MHSCNSPICDPPGLTMFSWFLSHTHQYTIWPLDVYISRAPDTPSVENYTAAPVPPKEYVNSQGLTVITLAVYYSNTGQQLYSTATMNSHLCFIYHSQSHEFTPLLTPCNALTSECSAMMVGLIPRPFSKRASRRIVWKSDQSGHLIGKVS